MTEKIVYPVNSNLDIEKVNLILGSVGMIRVLQVVTYMGRGGLETMLMNYYRNIDRSKVQFDFLVHRDFEADYDKEILALGGKIHHISRLIPWSKGYKNELCRFFKEHPEYKIVHVHQDCLSSVALQCAEECGVPVRIAHSHTSNQDKNLKYPIKKYYMKKIPDHATDLFACGKEAGEWMFGNHEFRVLPNAIDTSKYIFNESIRNEVRKELSITAEFVIGHIGRFNLPKNHLFLIDVFYECLRKNPDLKLLLVGDGDEKLKIQEKINKLGIDKNVIFTGVRTDVNRLLQAMDVFVFPSLYEGFPVTMVEAQASGIPCIISDKVPDECIITEGLVDVKSLSDSAEKWAECILSKKEVKRRNVSDDIIKSAFDIKSAAKWLEEFYIGKAK